MIKDYSEYNGEHQYRWAGIIRANRGGESWSTATVYFRSPEFHSIPEGSAEELAQILQAAEGFYSEHFKRIAVVHEPDDVVVLWSPRNASEGELSDYLRMPRLRLIELLSGWLRPEEIKR